MTKTLKATALISMVAAIALSLGACNEPASGRSKGDVMESTPLDITVNAASKGGSSYSRLGVWTDPGTGCQYITGEVSGGIFMTARIGADQLPICDKDKSADYETFKRLKKQFEEKYGRQTP